MGHDPLVRWLCVLVVATSGVICLGYAALLPLVVADEPEAVDWLAGLSEMWPLAGSLAGIGLLQLALAARGVWVGRAAEGTD